MLKILELIIQLHETTKMLEELLQKELKIAGVNLSIPEIICLSQSFQNQKEDIKFLSPKSIYTYQHLLFNLNKLEKKNFLEMKINLKQQKEVLVTFTQKGREIINLLDKQKISNIKNIPELKALREELAIK